MLAEVLHRRIKFLAGTAAAAMMLGGCTWDGYSDALSGQETAVSGEELTVGEDTAAADASLTEVSDEEIAEQTAMALVERWLGLLADGDGGAADELTAKRIRAVDSDFRLFNTDFPKAADISSYAPAVVKANAGGNTVTLKLTVIPRDAPENKVNADIIVSVDRDGSALIEYVTEIGSGNMRERKMLRRAKQAFDCAEKALAEIDGSPESGMYHRGEGSWLTEALEERMHPADNEDFSVAVRDGRIMYVCWSGGGITVRYPAAEKFDGLQQFESDYSEAPYSLDR
ncbi:hypothetical protein [uncultured Ruminococcus sp.]|uniref:hypothetical protein n=1 Tax=uncultured Ruminococcus sp. TaxID=165186 RepID=UPI000ECD4BFC|nr:hypothetical protein [uncultured Ruminococcus sp.]HCJ42130.1 hypothetical protein [Ruminococcus sp.]